MRLRATASAVSLPQRDERGRLSQLLFQIRLDPLRRVVDVDGL